MDRYALSLSHALSLSLSPDRTRAIHSAGVVSFHVNVSVLIYIKVRAAHEIV